MTAQQQETCKTEDAMPSVSVIMPVYNGDKYLSEAIASIRNQTIGDWELIVVNDGSSDRSLDIALEHAASDRRITVLTQPNAGIAQSLNRAMTAASAEWVARLDADDLATPNRLEEQLAFLAANPDVRAVGTYAWMMGPTGRVFGIQKLGPTSRDDYRRMLQENTVLALLSNSVTFHRETALRLGGHRSEYKIAEDFDMWSRIADDFTVLAIPEPLVYTRYHPNSITARRMVQMQQYLRFVEANIKLRRSGKPEIPLNEYRRIEANASKWLRFRWWLDGTSQGAYRRGGASLTAGDPRGVIWIALSILLKPSLPLQRFKRQGIRSILLNQVTQTKTNIGNG
jgi:glycosyltransferase involved in cell wall biosynthesis